MHRSSQISEDQVPLILSLLRRIIVNEPQVLLQHETYDQDTGRTELDPRFLAGYAQPGLEDIDWNSRATARHLSFLTQQAREYNLARPTLLKMSLEKWQNNILARQANQRALRRAALQVVVLRAIHENTNNVLMSWDSLAKGIEVLTGRRPGVEPTKRLFAWLASADSPVQVIRHGIQGNFGKSTTLRVQADVDDWPAALTEVELKKTVDWLATQDQVLGELYADEAARKADRPELKARWALAVETKLRNQARAAKQVFEKEGTTRRGVQATSLSNIKPVDKSTPTKTPRKFRWIKVADPSKPKGHRWERGEEIKPFVRPELAPADPAAEQATQDAANRLLGHLIEPAVGILSGRPQRMVLPARPHQRDVEWEQASRELRTGRSTDMSLLLVGIDFSTIAV